MIQMQPMRWGDPDLEAGMAGTAKLPCGAEGVADGCGYRCTQCFTIYGSVSCPCSAPSHGERK
jgi:hypothetical protein